MRGAKSVEQKFGPTVAAALSGKMSYEDSLRAEHDDTLVVPETSLLNNAGASPRPRASEPSVVSLQLGSVTVAAL